LAFTKPTLILSIKRAKSGIFGKIYFGKEEEYKLLYYNDLPKARYLEKEDLAGFPVSSNKMKSPFSP
jgi:hypothetical protein